jgi:hypothetical protein
MHIDLASSIRYRIKSVSEIKGIGAMARGGKRKGAGRKPIGKVAMLVRVAPEVRARLVREAKKARQSLSAATERHLTDTFRGQPTDPPKARALGSLIALAARACSAGTPFDLNDPFVFRALRLAMDQIFDFLKPQGEVQSIVDRLGEAEFSGVPASIVDSYRTPEARAKVAAEIVWTLIQEGVDPGTLAAARQLETGGVIVERMYYRMENIRRDLGIETRGDKK